MDTQRINEGLEFLKSGDKAATKGWFRKPDWDIAGQYYDKAASCFKAARSYEKAAEAFLKAADAQFKADSLFMAAKAYESAASMNIQMKEPERAAAYYRKASDLYNAHGSADNAAEMLEKGGKALESIDIEQSMELYIASCNLYESEDRGRFGVDTFRKTITILLKNRRFEKAVEMLQKSADINKSLGITANLDKIYLSIIIVLLGMGDDVEANKQYTNFMQGGFGVGDEAHVAQDIIEAFQNFDQEKLQEATSSRIVNFLDNEVARIARNLRVPGGGAVAAPVPDHTQSASDPVEVAFEPESIEEGGLC
ncbi:TPR-like protein [Basidiobolus meristosporus CBS 931.73]|uniref:Gamma-soluble NSF attachment protein n=1 Tax=Basidiobolus meristosporus CBS 931.73 TaxID=1314790 RepID=A0A1Y1Z5G7_9FUNG|nr:TPR-like protein [Basidiobolus meristosporus CBS 931.73]|eukprot:ORY05364.1 TPR-like protein [Basidiobolus meristosporus CBS 931.73]